MYQLRPSDPLMRDSHPEGLRDLFTQAIEHGRAFAGAEVAYYKATALDKVDRAKLPIVFLFSALLLVQAALTTLFVGIGFALAFWLGPLGGGIASAAIALAVAGLLVWLAQRRLAAKPLVGTEKKS
jgi:hypothetical protein